tara:strand:- start:48 stop:185 length:138 start_codon:yes stop_codon:yes gene_type:complete
MKVDPNNLEPGTEEYAFALTRRMFWYTVMGTVGFSIVISSLWFTF